MRAADRIVLQGMRFFGHHGDLPAERELGSHFDVDVEMFADLSVAGRSDSLRDTVDYTRCYAAVKDIVENRRYNLLESLAENIAQTLLDEPHCDAVRVRVAKQPPLAGGIRRCAVVVERDRGAAHQ
jgi:dihydroneopterin aldolase